MDHVPVMLDIAEMPDYNPITGSEGAHAVSQQLVYWDSKNKVCCILHKAMNAVNPDRTLWRCLTCHTGAYLPNGPSVPKAREQ